MAVHSIAVPVEGFKWQLVNYDSFLTIEFYYSQWKTYTEAEQQRLLNYLDKVKRTLEAYGNRVALDPIMDVKNVSL
jgi:hypothetical protein